VEKLIHDGAAAAAVTEALTQVTRNLDPLLARVRSTLPSADEKPAAAATAAAANPAAARAAIAQLAKLLAEFNPSATDFMDENAATLQPCFAAGVWVQFEKHVRDYNFADAQAQLEQAAQRAG
jgi:hypothetical protein